MSLYDELTQFQILPNALEEWADYRNAVTEYLMAHTTEKSSIAIFGAGRCRDIDLRQMADHFSSITLFDENRTAMQEALHTYGLSSHPALHLSQSDFTGITPADYRALSEELTAICNINGASTDIHILADYTIYKLNQLYEKSDSHILDFGHNNFDYSMAFGVHSQVNNMAAWIFSAFATNLNQSDPAVEERIIRANHFLIPRLNDAILRATRFSAFFGCEIENTSVSGSIQGACQCIEDIHRRGIVTEQAITCWPFDINQNKIYQMLIQQADCTHLKS